jgi:hypothetical protein
MTRRDFIERIAKLDLTKAGQAIALLWFYRQSQLFEERSVSELADDLRAEGLGRPNVTELKRDFKKSRMTVIGKRLGTFQINVKYLDELNKTYGSSFELREIPETSSILPVALIRGTRFYVEKITSQINGSYDYNFYDSCAVLLRRLMESLIIETFIHKKITNEIKSADGKFLRLDDLIQKICLYPTIHLGRSTPGIMKAIKQLGDTAAHDRTYITQRQDIDDIKQDARKVIQELLTLSGIIK